MNLMTRQEAAKRLRIGIRTLDRRLAAGDIKCYRLGDGPRAPVRISEEQISDYLQSATRTVSEFDSNAAHAIMARKVVGG